MVSSAILASSVATAGTVQDTIEKFGLLGRWAPDCSLPASSGNAHGTFSLVPPDEAQESFDFGPDRGQNTYRIIYAEPVEAKPNAIRLDVVFNETRHLILEIVSTESRIRTMSNIQTNGTVVVRDGVVLSSGRQTDLLSRCN